MAELTAAGKEANTVRLRQASLRAFARWLVEQDELPEDPLVGLKPPKLATKVVQALTDDQLRDLIKACKGPSFRDKRDDALVRLLSETGLRASECVASTMADVDRVDKSLDAGPVRRSQRRRTCRRGGSRPGARRPVMSAVHINYARARQQAHELYEVSLPALDCVHAQRLVVSEAVHPQPAPGQQ